MRPSSKAARRSDPKFRRAYARALTRSLAFYASEVLRGPREHGGKFSLGPHHLEWSDAVSAHARILALAARDHGKCVAEGSPVLMADGTWRPIEHVRQGEWVMSAGDHGLEPRRVEAVMVSGVKPVIEITFTTGRRLRVTREHKVLTPDGWREAGDLAEGDPVLGTADLTVPAVQRFSDDEVVLAAYILAEGCTSGSGLEISTASPEIAAEVVEIATRMGWVGLHEPGRSRVRVVASLGKGAGSRVDGPKQWARNRGLMGSAHSKRVPPEIMHAPDDQVRLFLNRFWSCDGYANAATVELTLANEGMIDDIRTLLHRVGVTLSKIPADKAGSTAPTWRLAAQHAPTRLKLLEAVGPFIGKPDQWHRAVAAARATRPQRPREWQPHGGYAAVRVKQIRELGEAPTRDLQIEGLHSFVVDHLVVHNSHCFCFAYPIWMADRVAPGRVGYIFSATEQQAIEHLDKIRGELLGGGDHGIDGNPKLAHLLPLKKNSRKTLQFANGSEIRARGFGTRVRGGHPFWIVCDDVGNDDWIWSETVRNKAIDYFLSAIEPMVVPGGQLIVVSTPFHATDLYNHLEEGGVFKVTKHPAILPNGQPLWPERYDMKKLEVKKRILNSNLRWSREYLCRPISDESSLFPAYLFDAPGVKQPFSIGNPQYWKERGFDCYMGVDLAMSASASADYLVCVVLAVDPRNGDRYIADIIREKGLGYQQQVDLIVNTAKRYEAGLVFVEANQYQRVISDIVVRSSDAPIKAFYTTGRGGSKQVTTERRGMSQHYVANKNALDQGVPGLRMLLENGKLRFPWALDEHTRTNVRVLITEMQSFGWAEGRMQGVGAHDDTVMALWFADRAASVGGAVIGADDDEEEAPIDMFGIPRGDEIDESLDFFGVNGQDDLGPVGGLGW